MNCLQGGDMTLLMGGLDIRFAKRSELHAQDTDAFKAILIGSEEDQDD